MHRVMLLQSDPEIAEHLYKYLALRGIQAVEEVGFVPDPQDVVVLDSLFACRRVRGLSSAPILALCKPGWAERTALLKEGADYALSKPVFPPELVVVLEALRRRASATSTLDDVVWKYEDLELDVVAHRCQRGSHVLTLTPKEYALLAFLMENLGRVLSAEQILDRIWGYGYEGASNVVAVYIHSLRAKLGEPQLIHTVRGVGYVIRPSQESL